MEVILLKNVDNLGYKDEVVNVKPGYGRNFLIPFGYALTATTPRKKQHDEMIRQREHKEEKIKQQAEEKAKKIKDINVTISAKVGENGKIFGSVNTVLLSEALEKEGVNIDRKSLKIMQDPIKELGTYEAEAKIHRSVTQAFSFEVKGE